MSDMTFDKMISQMTPAIYESLKQGVSLRKWPDAVSYTHLTLPTKLEV